MMGIYKGTLNDLSNDVAAFYAHIIENNEMNPQKMKKRVTNGKRDLKKLEHYIAVFDELDTIPPALVNRYKAINEAKHITRYEVLEAQVIAHMLALANEQEKRIAEHLDACARDDYYTSMYHAYRRGSKETAQKALAADVFISDGAVRHIASANWSEEL